MKIKIIKFSRKKIKQFDVTVTNKGGAVCNTTIRASP
jgi:hypothetical protein